MLADKRKVWGGVLIILLFCSIITFYILDNGMLCSVNIKSEEELMQICSEKIFVERAENAGNLLLFNNQLIPYDEERNCFYICQNIENKEYNGTITSTSENINIWIVKDDYVHEFEEAVKQSHSFYIWIVSKDSYTICQIIFTGLPVVVLHTKEEAETEYIDGSIAVWNPDDDEIDTVSCKESRIQLKCSESMETYTAKLMDNGGAVHRKLSLLDMGKYDAWKLYAVSPKDMTYVRSMLSYLLWNRINSIEKFNRPCRYAEVIVDNDYKGLFLLAPRIDDDFLELGESGEVVSVKRQGDEAFAAKTQDLDNLVEYFLFLEMTDAYENILDNFYMIWDSTCARSFLMPGKIEYSFGIFPNRYQYMTWHAQERKLTPYLIEFAGTFYSEDIKQRMGQKWQGLRSGVISNEELIKLVDELHIYLQESGYVARNGILNDNAVSYEISIEELINYLTERMEVLDRYYDSERQ